ncbi:MAG: CHASE3 domain-containing protein [Lacunisphaera sp.]|nr:CHASE3 domain-containing protein [Lacunisphaera sp.]
MHDNILTRVFALFLVILVVIAAMAAYALRTINRSMASSDWVNHSYAAIFECGHLGAGLVQADGLMRTYAQTGDPRDRAAARAVWAQLDDHFENAKALLRDEAAALPVLLRIEAQARERAALAQAVWTARASSQPEQAAALLTQDAGSTALAEMERGLGKLRDAQFAQLNERDHVSYLQAQMTRWVVGAGIGLNLGLLLGVAWLLRDDLAARRRAATALVEANAQLEDKVRARTAELSAANAQLRTENLERKWTIASQAHQLRYNQLIVNSVNDLVFVLTLAQTVTRINAAVVQLTGRVDETILARPLAQVVEVAREPARGLDPVERALLEGRELRHHPAVVLCLDGRRIPARLILTLIRDEDKIVGAVAVVQVALPASESIHPA